MAPPNLSGGRPLAEILTPSPLVLHRTASEHGTHSVVSTYRKKNPEASGFSVVQPTFLKFPETADKALDQIKNFTETTTVVTEIPEISTITENIKITEIPKPDDGRVKLQLDSLINEKLSSDGNQEEQSLKKENVPPTSDEDESMEEDFMEKTEKGVSTPKEELAITTSKIEPTEMRTKSLLSPMTPLVPIQYNSDSIQRGFFESPLQDGSSLGLRSNDVRNREMVQGFHPYDYHRMGQIHTGINSYGLPNPIISNGYVYYPTFSRSQLPLAREISNHPIHQIPSYKNVDSKLVLNNPSLNKNREPTELPPITTYRSRSKDQPPSETKLDRGHVPKSRSQSQKHSTTSSTTLPPASGSVSSPPGDSFLFESKFDLNHFEEELADFSNLYHHQKSLEELARSGKDVAVREDDWLLTSEGATAIILLGMCSIFMMIICFIFMLKKFKKAKGEQKVKKAPEESEEKAQTMWLDLYNPVNLIPQISYLHTLPHVDVPDKEITSKPSTSSMSNNLTVPKLVMPISPFVKAEEFTEAHLGRLWFTVRHDHNKLSLHVNIRHARYPKGREISGNTGELWIEGRVLSAMNTIIASSKTSTRRASPSPVFNHSFLFLLDEQDVHKCLLKLIMHDKHPKKPEEVVGSIILPLSSIDLSTNELLCRDLL